MTAPGPERLAEMAGLLVGVRGVVGVSLGGSRARESHDAASDTDLGIYYRPPLDTAALRRVAVALCGREVEVTEPGGWGPWVDGGAWLQVDGHAVDLIYRDIDRVADAGRRAARGQYAFHAQAGHPLGFLDVAYAGELALGRILADPHDDLARLRSEIGPYPPALADALVAGLWEAEFVCVGAAKGAARGDTAYVALCLARAALLCAHALHAGAGRWAVNEKGLLPAAALLPGGDPAMRDAARVLGELGATPEELQAAVAWQREVVEAVRQTLRHSGH